MRVSTVERMQTCCFNHTQRLVQSSCKTPTLDYSTPLREPPFKRLVGNAPKATRPCAVAYGYARIRRLVRLGAGLYRFPATAHQWSGLVARVNSVVHASVLQVFHYL